MIFYLFPRFKVNFEVCKTFISKIISFTDEWYSFAQHNNQKEVTCRLKDFDMEANIDGILHMYINFYSDFNTCT